MSSSNWIFNNGTGHIVLSVSEQDIDGESFCTPELSVEGDEALFIELQMKHKGFGAMWSGPGRRRNVAKHLCAVHQDLVTGGFELVQFAGWPAWQEFIERAIADGLPLPKVESSGLQQVASGASAAVF
ncbi:MAG: hypothetical protein A2580_18110 [Hydrogenophilales bacterium RIFOXYD1_FULL_62_11]|nr:MAG: hypothetical protein A2580_18110 [Hydrogenophilales bacterium RIFOXYD1_FULL_62_11]